MIGFLATAVIYYSVTNSGFKYLHNYATLSYFMTVHTVSVTIKGCMNTNRFLPLVEPTGLAVSLPKWPRLSGIAGISQRSTRAHQFVPGPVI